MGVLFAGFVAICEHCAEEMMMAGTPTFATPSGFLGITRADRDAAFTIAGIPFDIGTTNRAGTRDGPVAIRRASRMLVDGAHPAFWVDPAELDLADIGDFRIALGDIPGSLALIEDQAKESGHLLCLGGEHGITLPLLRALTRQRGKGLALVHFDAHVDTWPTNFGQDYAHGSVFYHAIREGLIDPHRMIQIGIRSPVQRDVWDWTIDQGVTILSALDVHAMGPLAVAERIRAVAGEQQTYLTVAALERGVQPACDFAAASAHPEDDHLVAGGICAFAQLRHVAGRDS
jgi:arginase family enzyme